MDSYESLLNLLIRGGYLKTPHIIEGFKAIDRVDFVPEEYIAEAYVNAPLHIGFGQTISQPLTVAFMIELLQPKLGEKILEIGAGSGWQTAILAYLVSQTRLKADYRPSADAEDGGLDNGRWSAEGGYLVVAIERIPELKDFAQRNISKYNFIEKGIAGLILGDGFRGYKKEAPYDKIIAGAASAGDVPQEWRKQLKIGGRIVAPVDQSIAVIDKISKNDYDEKKYFGFSFVPLIKNE